MTLAPRADCVIKAVERQVSTVLDGEAVILQLETGVYFGLNPVGTHIWTLLQARPYTAQELAASILDTFEIDHETCLKDLQHFLDRMVQKRLVEFQETKNV